MYGPDQLKVILKYELQLTTANAKLNVLRKEKRIGQKDRKSKFDHILYREMARHCNDIIRQYVFL